MNILIQHKPKFDKVITHLKEEIATFKSGRATPAMVDNINVIAYGMPTPLKQLASITVSDPKTLVIEPWDKSILKDVEKAISQSHLNLNPIADAKVLRVVLPPLTEESRRDLIKLLNEKQEKAHIAMRQIRDDIKNEITEQERSAELTEDEKYAMLKGLDELVGEMNLIVKQTGQEKEKEILTI